MLNVSTTGSYDHLRKRLADLARVDFQALLRSHGARGVQALTNATPVDSGLAAGSWGFTVTSSGGVYTLAWTNTDVESGFPVAIMLQYGYSTGTGGFVMGEDYINPAIRPIFDDILDSVRKAVK